LSAKVKSIHKNSRITEYCFWSARCETAEPSLLESSGAMAAAMPVAGGQHHVVGAVPPVPFIGLALVQSMMGVSDEGLVVAALTTATARKKESGVKKSFDSMSAADLLAQEDPSVEAARDQLVVELLLDALKAGKEAGLTAPKLMTYLHVHQQFAAELRAATKAAAAGEQPESMGDSTTGRALFSVLSGKEAGARLFDDLMARHVVGLAEEHAAVVTLNKNNNGVIPGEGGAADAASSGAALAHMIGLEPPSSNVGGIPLMEVGPQGSLESLGGKSSMLSAKTTGTAAVGAATGVPPLAGVASGGSIAQTASVGNEGSLMGGGSPFGGGGGLAGGANDPAGNSGFLGKFSLKEAEVLTR
jgi:hypothetical protein